MINFVIKNMLDLIKPVYNNDYYPLYHEIIKENVKKEKKCEYEFKRTVFISSSY